MSSDGGGQAGSVLKIESEFLAEPAIQSASRILGLEDQPFLFGEDCDLED
jgi:hypothetical protein